MSDWNHNIHYHSVVLEATQPNCKRALDVGCGEGLLARKLSQQCQEVIAIDDDPGTVVRARAASNPEERITFVEGDVMSYPFANDSFDLITAVATLHHLALRPALARFRSLSRSGGTLAVVGLYRPHVIQDYAWNVAALPASFMLRRVRHFSEVQAPLKEAAETLREIRAGCEAVLPGGVFRRRLLFRYSFVWRKP